jgi:hypothetical protein
VGLADTPFQRGRLLSRVIRREVQRQFVGREAGADGRDVAEWSILYLRVHGGLSLQEIAGRLNMPVRSVARYYARGKELLLDRLYTLQEQAPDTGIHCASCGGRLTGVQQQLSGHYSCDACGAEMDVSALRGGTLQITMTPEGNRDRAPFRQ